MQRLKELAPFAKEALHQTARLASFFCCLHVTNTYLCTVAYLVGPSMLPNFSDGNIVLAEKITTRLGRIEPGDVVLVRSPENPRSVVTKRVKGVEGDVVTYALDLSEKGDELKSVVVVPKGHVWVEGDNVQRSHDSRMFGAIPFGLVQARIFYRVWPLEDRGTIGKSIQ